MIPCVSAFLFLISIKEPRKIEEMSEVNIVKETYLVFYGSMRIGNYYVYTNGRSSLDVYELPEGLTKGRVKTMISKMFVDANRLSGTRKYIWQSGNVRVERESRDTARFWIYQRYAKKGEPTYSEKSHSAPHSEGRIIEGMEEWASWYCFNKKDDGMYEAELDEAWNEGSHNGGGTIRVEVPGEWLDLTYDEFLERVVTLASASHYGFTPDELKDKKGLKAFFGFDAE